MFIFDIWAKCWPQSKFFSSVFIVFLTWSSLRANVGVSAIDVSLTVDVAAGVRECLHHPITKGVDYEVEYQVLDGGDLDINFIVQTPSGIVIVPDIRKTGDLHKLTASETGDYEFCLDNSFSHFTNKVVFFELITDEDDSEDDPTSFNALPDTHDYEITLEEFKDPLDKIYDKLQKSIQLQKVFSALELRDRSIIENNFERVNFWSGVQVFVMISAAVANVLMIRSLFQDRSQSSKGGTKMRT
jgi:protein ERP2